VIQAVEKKIRFSIYQHSNNQAQVRVVKQKGTKEPHLYSSLFVMTQTCGSSFQHGSRSESSSSERHAGRAGNRAGRRASPFGPVATHADLHEYMMISADFATIISQLLL
jgi:hypothetical protein